MHVWELARNITIPVILEKSTNTRMFQYPQFERIRSKKKKSNRYMCRPQSPLKISLLTLTGALVTKKVQRQLPVALPVEVTC